TVFKLMGILQVPGIGLFIKGCNGLAVLQVVIKEIFGKAPNVKLPKGKVDTGLEAHQGTALQGIQERILFQGVRPVPVKGRLVITEVCPKGHGTLFSQAHPIGIVYMRPEVVEQPFPIGEQAQSYPASIADPTAIAQEIDLIVVIKGYRLVSVKQIDIGLVLPHRGKRWVEQKPIELQKVLGRDIVGYINLLFLPANPIEGKQDD